MVVTDDIVLPTYEELTVPEIKLSSVVLRASGVYFGKYCDDVSKEFMLCRNEERDPRKCINEGKAVTACGMEFYKKVKKSCREELEKFSKCVEWTHPDFAFYYCRKQQAFYDNCMLEKMGIEKPPYGYFTQICVHESARPKPKSRIPHFEPTPELPEDFPIRDAPHGWRRDWH